MFTSLVLLYDSFDKWLGDRCNVQRRKANEVDGDVHRCGRPVIGEDFPLHYAC